MANTTHQSGGAFEIGMQLLAALGSEDDRTILQACDDMLEDDARLRPGERARITAARTRVAAERRVADEIGASLGASAEWHSLESDEAILAAAWEAIRLGCSLPPALKSAMLGARRRILDRRRADRFSSEAIQSELDDDESVDDSLDVVPSQEDDGTDHSIDQLRNAISNEDVIAIATAASDLSRAGVRVSMQYALVVADAHAAAESLSQFRDALVSGNDAVIGREWARISTRWPAILDDLESAAGQASFRRSGRANRRNSRAVVMGDKS